MPVPFGEQNQDAETTATRHVGNGRNGQDGDTNEARPALVPTLNLPKGGGAIRGLGEAFSVAAPTGTGGMSIPIASSPGRGGADLGLGLRYDSGAGNGVFGLGWQLSPPSISRKTDRGVPRYLDGQPDGQLADTFVLAGAEDLVPALDEAQQWAAVQRSDVDEGAAYRVYRYRPRVEGGFARIERWVRDSDRVTHWRVTDRNNITSFFGRTDERNSRVADPAQPSRVFRWLLDEVRDDRGNVTIYSYKPEDLDSVTTQVPWESSRASVQAQRYLKRISYGNRTMDVADDFMFEVVFDYGEHGTIPPRDEASTASLSVDAAQGALTWPA
ncbi:MAG: toxin, partial [Nannocystaceae bacterium]|nr:toxin [Nannocystaceae bacterium]